MSKIIEVTSENFQEEVLESDEFEALKLHGSDNLNQVNAAKKMGVSQSTFARILDRAYKKVSRAIVLGKAIRIEKNNIADNTPLKE